MLSTNFSKYPNQFYGLHFQHNQNKKTASKQVNSIDDYKYTKGQFFIALLLNEVLILIKPEAEAKIMIFSF